jgi:hypothetical protein
MANDSLQLVFRMAQLETELRFTQETLSQVEGVNRYLLQQLASRASTISPLAQPQTKTPQDSMEASNSSTSLAHASQSRETTQDTESSAGSGAIDTSGNVSDDSDPRPSKEGQARIVELQPSSGAKATLQDAPHRINSPGKTVDADFQHRERKDSVTDIGQVQKFARPIRRYTPVARRSGLGSLVHFEYHRLLGAACFIEDMDAEGKAAHWRTFARNFPNVSAAQWESYYESDVRPIYLEKQRARESAVVPPSRVELNHHGHAVGTDSAKTSQNEGTDPTSHNPKDGEVGCQPQEMPLAVPDEQVVPLIAFDDGDDEADAPAQPVADSQPSPSPSLPPTQIPPPITEPVADSLTITTSPSQPQTEVPPSAAGPVADSEPSPSPPHLTFTSPTQAPPPTKPRNMPPLDIEHLFHQPSASVPFPHRTAIITNVPPELATHSGLSKLQSSDIISAIRIRTSGMRLKSGVMDTDTILIVFKSGERLEELVKDCGGKWSITSPGQSDSGTATISVVKTATHPGLLGMRASGGVLSF